MSMKQNAKNAAKVAKLRRQRNKARHALRLMKSARDNVQAQLARERRSWERLRQEGLEANQNHAGTIQALRADLASATRDRDHFRQVAHEATVALEQAQNELDRLTSGQAIRVPVVAEVDFTDALAMDEVYADPQPSVYDASSTERLRWFARRAQRKELLDLLEAAWGIIANAGPIDQDPPTASPGWSEAAVSWRERYHDLLRRLRPLHIHVSMGIGAKGSPEETAQALREALEARVETSTQPRFGGILPTDLLGQTTQRSGRTVTGSHDPTTAAGTSMVEPARTEQELEDALLDARAAQAMAEYQERTGLTAEQVAAQTARGLLDAIDSPLADSTPEEVAALAALADTLAPLRQYEPLSAPAGIVTQDRATGQVVDDTSAACEARIAPSGETTAEAASGFAYTPGEAAKAALAEGSTTDAQAVQAAREAALEAGERRCPKGEPHWGHDWWDDHEPDATKWFCEGIPAPEVDAEPRPGESWEDMNERHAAYAESAGVPTPTIGTEAMEDAIQAAVQAGTWTEGDFTVRDTDGSTATYAWDGIEPISTTPPPPIELEPERYEALLTCLRDDLGAEEPEADASDILEALGIYVPEEWAQPTELEVLAEIAPATGAVDRLVADVLAHAKGGINNPGDWFLTAASAFYPELGTYGSSQRDHIWELATELARQRITADHTATAIILEREQEALAVTTERVGRFTETLAGYDAMLAQLGAPPA